jgi:geranylgeranyl diphosphate synthase type II
MDQAPLRRGKETVYKKWNTNIAILSGDTLFAMANRHMLKTHSPEIAGIMDLFNATAIEVCEGQQLDMNFESRDDVSIAEYIEMIRLKTAVLLAASLKTGAMVAGTAPSVSQNLYDFGVQVGIAFQLMDDLLDVYGLEEKFGKMSGGDIVAGKKTFLYLKALELSGPGRNQLSGLYLSKETDPLEKVKAVKLIFDALHIRDITLDQVDLYWKKAVEIMESTGLGKNQTAHLLAYCSGLMKRDY